MLLTEEGTAWDHLLMPAQRSDANVAASFAILCRGAAGVEQAVAGPHRGYPFKLFALTLAPSDVAPQLAASIIADPDCCKDPFSLRFLDRFGHDLAGAESMAVLMSVAVVARVDIARLECRHAALRRVLRKRTHTWAVKLMHASSDTLLMRQRILQASRSKNGRPGASSRVRARGAKQRRSGGAQRAFISKFLQGRRMPRQQRKEIFRRANLAFARCTPAELEALRTEGEAGVRAFRAGGVAFGRRSARPRHAPLLPAPAPSPPGPSGAIESALVAARRSEQELQLMELRRARSASVAAAAAGEQLHEEALCTWAADASAAAAQQQGVDIVCSGSLALGAKRLPTGCQGGHYECMCWIPLASDMARRALSGWQAPGDSKFMETLRASWAELHTPIMGETCPSLGRVTYPHVSDCFLAGFCLCDARGVYVRVFVARWRAALALRLRKGSSVRVLYDSGMLVLRLTSGVPAAGNPDEGEGVWFHLSYGNLKTGRYTLMALSADMASARGRIALQRGLIALQLPALADGADSALPLMNLWQSCDQLDLAGYWYMQVFRLHQASTLAQGPFRPGLQLLAERVTEPAELAGPASLWSGPPDAPGQARRRAEQALAEIDPDMHEGVHLQLVGADVEDDLPAPLADALRALDDYFMLDHEEGESGLGEGARNEHGWEPSESDASEDAADSSSADARGSVGRRVVAGSSADGQRVAVDAPPQPIAVGDDAESGAGGGAGAGAAAGGGPAQSGGEGPAAAAVPKAAALQRARERQQSAEDAAAAEAMPELRAAVPAPPAPAGQRGAGAGVPADGVRRPHPTWHVDVRGDGLCYIKHDERLQILSAHCRHPNHGALCRVNRTLRTRPRNDAQGKPVGFLLAWMACADDYADQASHHAIAAQARVAGVEALSFENRSSWREWARVHSPGLTELAARVEAGGAGTGEEPEGLC